MNFVRCLFGNYANGRGAEIGKRGAGRRSRNPARGNFLLQFRHDQIRVLEDTFQIRRLETGTVADKLYAKAVTKSVDQLCS